MSTLVYSEPVTGVEMACQAEIYRETRGEMRDITYNVVRPTTMSIPTRDTGQTDGGGRLLPRSSDPSNALHTLVDMALALEESSTRRADHTYALAALKKQCRKLPTEDTDNVSNEKDHTYASNTIGFRYSNHRSTQAQPRKSVSEESLLAKSSLESTARKCTSAEEFATLDQLPVDDISAENVFHTPGSNSATLPRSKHRMLPSSARSLQSSSYVCFDDPTFFTAPDVVMDLPVKGDHTYAKFGTNMKRLNPSDPISALNLLSTSAPGKIEHVNVESVTHTGSSDHTYNKLSSAKLKDIQHKLQAYRLSTMSNEAGGSQEAVVNNTHDEVHSNFTLNSSIMDWQPQENFETRFLPMDHTYTTVS